ncbi:MAG: hypothetical protein IKN80_07710 [Clostridiales bacterium]|nr:hypothetical protein [Clostridiales bacterium]
MPKAEIKYEIIKNIGVLATNKSGWQREANIVKWNEGKAKLDIRDWGPDHEKVGKGISLNDEEVAILKALLEDFDPADIEG